METIVLEDFHDLYNYYYYVVDPEFAFCSKEKNGKAELLTQFATCRETIAGELFAKISGIFNDRRRTFQHRIEKIPTDKTCIALRLILAVDEYYAGRRPKRIIKEQKALDKMHETFPKSIEMALHILNLIEDQYGWEKTTANLAIIKCQGYNVKPSGATAKMMAACFYADKRWMRSPHMLSLFLLLLRLPFTAAGSLRGAMKIQTVSKLLEKFKVLRGRSGDGAHARTAGKYIPMIFKNFDELFGKGMGKNFDPDNYKERYNSYWGDYTNYVTEGFNILCTGKSTNIKIAKAFAILSKDSKVTMEVAARADG